MFYQEIVKIFRSFLFLYAFILVIPFALAAYYEFIANPIDHPQPHSTAAFGLTILLCLIAGVICYFFSRAPSAPLYRREAIAASVLIWFITPAIGALPFIFSDTLDRFDQAYLEATSGFTTSGASVFEAKNFDKTTGQEIPIVKTYTGVFPSTYTYFGNITPVYDPATGKNLEGLEAVSRAILFWRSFSQWLGGMGIIVLFVAFLPGLGIGGKFLFQAEAQGISKEGISPRIKETAINLWKIYVGLTVILIFTLIITNSQLPFFDAISLAFSTISTGGLAIHDHSVAFYNNSATEFVIAIFMILGGINFALYYYIIKGKFSRLIEPEFILYLTLILVFSLFAAWYLYGYPKIGFSGEDLGTYSLLEALKGGFFQMISTQTSTGFFTHNYDNWPIPIQGLLLLSMFMGGMAGSTSGGIKIIRIGMLFVIAKNQIESIFRPKTVKILRIGTKVIDRDTKISVLCFFFIVIFFCTIGTFVYILDNIDPETSLSLSVAMVNNTGLGFRLNGPTGTLAFLSIFPAYFSSFLMILGRLEFYAVLVTLSPAFWKEN